MLFLEDTYTQYLHTVLQNAWKPRGFGFDHYLWTTDKIINTCISIHSS